MSTVTNTTGKQWAKVKMADRFLMAWEQVGIPGGRPVAEYQFDLERKWRFDLAFPEPFRIAIEFDGAGFGHMSHKGRRQDMEKRNEAVRRGWRVLVYESSMMSLSRMEYIVEAVADCLSPPVDVNDLLPIGAA